MESNQGRCYYSYQTSTSNSYRENESSEEASEKQRTLCSLDWSAAQVGNIISAFDFFFLLMKKLETANKQWAGPPSNSAANLFLSQLSSRPKQKPLCLGLYSIKPVWHFHLLHEAREEKFCHSILCLKLRLLNRSEVEEKENIKHECVLHGSLHVLIDDDCSFESEIKKEGNFLISFCWTLSQVHSGRGS